jgi:hypothetical protein
MRQALIAALAGVFALSSSESKASDKEWLSPEDLASIIQPAGKFRDRGQNWCQFYDKDGTFIFKNLKTGETRLGKHWIDDKGRVCIKGPKMSSPECIKAYYTNDRNSFRVVGGWDGAKVNIAEIKASHNACKF